MKAPVILTDGPPPERHAARVVAEMCQWLAGEQWRLHDRLLELMRGNLRKIGNPKAQTRWFKRATSDPEVVGARLLAAHLKVGTRGRCVMTFMTWRIAAPGGKVMERGDPIPHKPWLVCVQNVVTPRSREDTYSCALITFTHHALQRLAERCAARTTDDLLMALREAGLWMVEHSQDEVVPGEVMRVPVTGGVAIVEIVPGCGFMAKTVLPPNEETPCPAK